MFFDPMYFIFVGPVMLLAMWAQWRVKSTFKEAKKYRPSSGMSGAETAQRILEVNGMRNVSIEQVAGTLSDHYDPRSKTLRLSADVYSGRTLAAVGIAAHEVGHALQDRKGYLPLKLRNGIVPMASIGGRFAFIVFFVGLMLSGSRGGGLGQMLVIGGLALFAMTVVFQLINLPVEFNASSRAKRIIVEQGIIAPQEQAAVRRVLSAAAMTYVAATISAIMTLLYFLYRSGLLGGRRD